MFNGIDVHFAIQNDSGSTANNINISKIGFPESASTLGSATYPLKHDTFYDFKVADDGFNLKVFIGDFRIPILSVAETYRPGTHIGIFNREGSGGGSSISSGSVTQLAQLTIYPESNSINSALPPVVSVQSTEELVKKNETNALAPQVGRFIKPQEFLNSQEALSLNEIKTMLRAKLPETEIIHDIKNKGIIVPIEGLEAGELVSLGASESLLNMVKNLEFVLTPSELIRFLERNSKRLRDRSEAQAHRELVKQSADYVMFLKVNSPKDYFASIQEIKRLAQSGDANAIELIWEIDHSQPK